MPDKKSRKAKLRRRRARRNMAVCLALCAACLAAAWFLRPRLVCAVCLLAAFLALILAVLARLRVWRGPIPKVAAACLLAAGTVLLYGNFVEIGGHTYRTNVQTLDLRGAAGAVSLSGVGRCDNLTRLDARDINITDASALAGCDAISYIDLRGCDVGAEAYRAIRAARPTCEILWDVPLAGGKTDGNAETVDLTGETFGGAPSLLDCLALFPKLREADLRGVPIENEWMDEARAAYPNVVFRWDVDVCGAQTDSESEFVALAGADTSDADALIDALSHLDNLVKIDARGAGLDADGLNRLFAAFPDAEIQWDCVIGGAVADSDMETLDLSGKTLDLAQMRLLLAHMPNLRSVRLYESTLTDAETTELALANPGIALYRDVTLDGQTLGEETETLDFAGRSDLDLTTLRACLTALPNLKRVDLTGCNLTEDEKRALADALPNAVCAWEFTICGAQVHTTDEKLKLCDAQISGADALIKDLSYMKNLTYLDLTGCSLSNEDCARVRESLPNATVVWEVHIGIFTVRTNATAFSTFHSTGLEPYYYSEDFSVLKYCTSMLALDIGHNYADDLSWLEEMPQLKVLILVDNKISDISSLSKLTNLEYLELFVNDVADLSPLSGLDKLIDLNVGYNNVKDIEPLLGLTGLQRLWLTHNEISYADQLRLREALPNCVCDFTADTSVAGGWRVNERYNIIYEMFKNGYYIDWNWNAIK